MSLDKYLPAKTPPPSGDYYIGVDFVLESEVANFCIFNKTTNTFEHQIELKTSSEDDFHNFCEELSKYFKAPILKEVR